MFRYLNAAFWARPPIWGLGWIPWNAVAVTAAAIMGYSDHTIWLAAGGVEAIYLLALATNSRFQNMVDTKELARIQGTDADAREAMLKTLSPVTVNRYRALEKKVANIEQLYRLSDSDDLLFDNNVDALKKLMLTYLRLLAAQRSFFSVGGADENQVRAQIEELEKNLGATGGSDSLRQSREATLALLRQRLRNLSRREDTLAEIASDLTRIETQIDLALEDATLKGRPTAVSAHLDFVSQLFIDVGSPDEGNAVTMEDHREVER